jgi:magnesium chelatase family protein
VNGKKATQQCPCGWLGHASGRCHCTPDRIARYRSRISGPLIDRIDLGIEVPALAAETLAVGVAQGDSDRPVASAHVRAEVTSAREKQMARQGKPNARLGPREIEAHCLPGAAGAAALAQAMARLSLSARAYHRILKVARTIADLAGSRGIAAPHVAEAVAFAKVSLVRTQAREIGDVVKPLQHRRSAGREKSQGPQRPSAGLIRFPLTPLN